MKLDIERWMLGVERLNLRAAAGFGFALCKIKAFSKKFSLLETLIG
jgi:hypothetical protein